jgi:4-hydroxybenzoyl-CoA reductase subunit beta
MGTMGGNLCQENRCRFFNQSVFWRSVRPLCFKAGGEICHVVKKARQCHSTYCGDLAPVLIALGAEINLLGPNGERRLPLRRLYTGNGAKPLSLKKGEILREVFIPSSSGETVYLKWRLRDSLEYPIVSVAVSLDRSETRQINPSAFPGLKPGVCSGLILSGASDHISKDGDWRRRSIKKATIVFSGVGPNPVETLEARKILNGGPLDDGAINRASAQAVKEISPMRTSIHSPAYKRKMAGILLRQALEKLREL